MSIRSNITDAFGAFNGIPKTPRVAKLARVLGLLAGIGGWYALASVFPNQLMPYPIETIRLMVDLVVNQNALRDVGSTLFLTFWGFLGSLLLGGFVGVVMGVNNFGQKMFTPYVNIGLSIPAVAWAAISTVIFGFSILTPLTATVATTFPFIAINIWKGVEKLEPDLIRMSKSFNVSNLRLIWRLVLPSTAPSLFTASRFGIAISWKIVTLAEVFSSNIGVGTELMTAYQQYRFETAWAWAGLFIVVILIIEYGMLKPLQRKVFNYRRDADFQLIA